MKKLIYLLVLAITISTAAPISLNQVDSWAIQLNNINLTEIKQSGYDMIVLDEYIPQQQIVEIKQNKLILSTFSILEADQNKFYWKNSWSENPPKWINNRVRFWTNQWKSVLKQHIRKLIDQGFDGIYIESIDTENYQKQQSQKQIINLINLISEYSKRIDPGFIIIIQNNEDIINQVPDKFKEKYFAAIDGIAKENLFYRDNEELNSQETNNTIGILNQYQQNDKIVLILDYTQNQTLMQDFNNISIQNKFIPYTTTRDLDILNIPILFNQTA